MPWDIEPFEGVRRLHDEMDRMFNRVLGNIPTVSRKDIEKYGRFRMPRCDVQETEKSVIATVELPGVEKSDIQLNVSERNIEVKVEKKQEKEVKKKGAYSYAAESKQFYRSIPLPTEVIASEADATYKNGILKVEIPKTKKEKKTKINIK